MDTNATPTDDTSGCDAHDLRLLIDSGVPIIAVESHDEARVLALLRQQAGASGRHSYSWTVTGGLQRNGYGESPADAGGLRDAEAVLRHIEREPGGGLYTLCDLHPWLDEPMVVRLLKDIALAHAAYPKTIVLLSHGIRIPPELSRLSARFQLSLPSEQELLAIVREEASAWGKTHCQRVRADQKSLQRLVGNLRGVSHADARTLVRHAIVHDGAITDSDLPEINRLKFQLLDAEGVLRFEHDTVSMADVAGFRNLKRWLAARASAFGTNDRPADDRPRGVLLLGIQGGGKSLAARAIAGQLRLPLLRLDFGALYNKFIGETERNLRDSLRQAEQMAPCVLWMDEIEKGVATGGGDNATARRVLGTLLTWLAENDTPVFVVATANDVSELPPELMRKGRLDEIFFVDLPDVEARRAVLSIHLAKRGLDPTDFDLDALATICDGFTCAEIEQAIVSARYGCDAEERRMDTAAIARAIKGTYPISVVMREQIDALRRWAAERTVMA